MALNSLLRVNLGRGEFTNTTPVIIQVTSPDRLQEVVTIIERSAGGVRRVIPRFNMVSGRLPNDLIMELSERDELVQIIYFDAEVPLPTSPISADDRLFKPSSVIGGILGVPRAVTLAARAAGVRPVDLLNQTAFAASKFLPAPAPRPGWVATSTVRTLLGADLARADGIEGAGVKVAIIDTGAPAAPFARRQPQLMGKVEQIHLTRTPRPDRSGHGTHVATIAAGDKWRAPNGLLLEGVAPGADLLTIKVLQTPLGIGRTSDILKGMEVAADNGANVVNMSLGSEGYVADNPFEGPLALLTAQGVIFVVAAGNSGPGAQTIGTPGGSPLVWSVGSISTAGQVAGFSSRGPVGNRIKPDMVGYGGDDVSGEAIYSTTAIGSVLDRLDGRFADGIAPARGTSQATPGIAGLIALWWEWLRRVRGRELTNADVMTIMTRKSSSKNPNFGWGVPTYNDVKVL